MTKLLFLLMLAGALQEFDLGMRVGEKIPAFRLISQEGKELDFQSIKGPNGAAILFFRSADW